MKLVQSCMIRKMKIYDFVRSPFEFLRNRNWGMLTIHAYRHSTDRSSKWMQNTSNYEDPVEKYVTGSSCRLYFLELINYYTAIPALLPIPLLRSHYHLELSDLQNGAVSSLTSTDTNTPMTSWWVDSSSPISEGDYLWTIHRNQQNPQKTPWLFLLPYTHLAHISSHLLVCP